MDLDATDRDLLAALLEDARISQRGLAKRVGVAQGTITNRLRRLEGMGVIKGYTVLLDAESRAAREAQRGRDVVDVVDVLGVVDIMLCCL